MKIEKDVTYPEFRNIRGKFQPLFSILHSMSIGDTIRISLEDEKPQNIRSAIVRFSPKGKKPFATTINDGWLYIKRIE